VNGKNVANFAVEINFTSLDAGSKQCALAYFENCSGQSNTIGVKQASNADAVTNIEIKHPVSIP
jgi:hypothetical protein